MPWLLPSIEYVDLAFKLIQTETNDNNLSLLLGHIHSTIAVYFPFKYMLEYKQKYFILLRQIFQKELCKFNYSYDIIKKILGYLPANITNEEDRKYLIKLLNLD